MEQKKEKITLVSPLGPDSNNFFAKHLNIAQTEAELDVECYFDQHRVLVPVYRIDREIVFESLKGKHMAFFAFQKDEDDDTWQFYYSENIRNMPFETLSVREKEVVEIFKKIFS